MNILFVASELVPFAKTGGLADVVSSLAAYMKSQGHTVRVVIPYYGSLKAKNIHTRPVLTSMGVQMGPGIEEWCAVHEASGTGDVPVWLIEHDGFYQREGIYHDDAFNDYGDNPRRYAFLSRAALQICIDTGFSPDIIHAHDWQAALTLAYQKLWFPHNPIVGSAASILTIHNAQYQGIYSSEEHYRYMGFSWEFFKSDIFEDYGRINMLKAGIHFADVVNTVSPTHAKEISAPYSEFGLAPYLNAKGHNFCGILNGIDYSEWNPQEDRLTPAQYSIHDMSGKQQCKAELQRRFCLNLRPEVPVIGIVGRMVPQKGYHLLMPVLDQILNEMDVQFAFVGSGDKDMEKYIEYLPRVYGGRFGSWIGYSNEYAHLVEAGADLFLMPSIFEPCGLNQIYSLKYGTLPIVRTVGGLADTVDNYNPHTGIGTGFTFDIPTPEAVLGTIRWAVDTWYRSPEHFEKMKRIAMDLDFSWEETGKYYSSFYTQAQETRNVHNRQHAV